MNTCADNGLSPCPQFGDLPGSRVAGSPAVSPWKVWRNPHAVVQHSCTMSHPRQQTMWLPFPHVLTETFLTEPPSSGVRWCHRGFALLFPDD